MHSPQTIQRFIDLRATANPLIAISDQLHVPISTLGDWNKRYAGLIAEERAIKWELCERSATLSVEDDLIRLALRIKACEAELARRPLSRMTTSELLRVLTGARREYFRRRNPLLKPLEAPDTTHKVPASARQAADCHCASEIALRASRQTTPSAKPEKTGNISDFPSLALAAQQLTTNENHTSDSPLVLPPSPGADL